MLLDWVIVFFVLALLAGIFGFGGIATEFASIAKLLFFLFIVLFVISLLYRLVSGRPPQSPL